MTSAAFYTAASNQIITFTTLKEQYSNIYYILYSLLVKAGGLGIRRAASLALPAYLASATSTASLQDLILIRSVAAVDKYYTLYRSNWSSAYNQSLPLDVTACKQRAWDEPIVKDDINHLFATASQRDKSRLLAVTHFLIVVSG